MATQTDNMLSKYLVPVEKEKDSAFDFSIDQAQRLLGKGVEVAGKFTGIEGMEQFGADVVAQQEKDIEEGGYTPEYQGSLREAYQQGGIDNALGWLKEKSVENLVSSGTAIAGTGLAAITAPFSIPASLAITGATIGSSVLMGAGESAQEMEDKTGTYDANVAVGVGALVGILDKFGAGKVIPKGKLSNMTGEELITALAKAGKPEAGKAIAARIGKATAGEAGTEALQESAIMGGAALTGGEYTGLEIADKIIDSAALGGTMGGATRGAGELVGVAGRTSPSSLVDRAKGQMEDIFRGPDDTSGLALAGDVPSDALQQQEDETTAKAQIDEMMIGEGTTAGDEGARQWREKAKKTYIQSMSDIQEDADEDVLQNDYRLFKNLKDEDKRSIFKETGAYVDEIDGQIKTEIPSYNAELDETVLNDEQFFTRERTMTGPKFKVKTRKEQADYLGINILTVNDLQKIPILRVRDILKFPEFYEQYDKEMVGAYGVTYQPIGDIPVSLETDRMAGGSYSPSLDEITIMSSKPKFIKETLLHELQHAIQHRHGFVQGDSPSRYLPENVDSAKEKIKKEIKQGVNQVKSRLNLSPLTREKYREYKDSTKYTPQEINDRLETIIYALANRTVSQPLGDTSIVSKDLAKKKMPKVLPTTIDGPAITYDAQQVYEKSVEDLQKLYDVFPASEKVGLLQKFVNLSVLNHRLDTAEKIASLTYRLASGELESRNVENRHRIALEKYIKEGKNPDKALRELYPMDTRGLPKSFVNYFKSPQYKNISKLGRFKEEELLAPDRSSGFFGSRRDSTEQIINLNKALSFDTENIDDFINKLKAPEDKIRNLRINMALKFRNLDRLQSAFLGRTSTADKVARDETGTRMNFSIAISELSARMDPEYEFYKPPIEPPIFYTPVKTNKEYREKLESSGVTTDVDKVGKIVSDVKQKLLSSGLDNITTEVEKLIASFYLGYPIRVGSEPENVRKLGIKRPADVPSDAVEAFIVAPNSIINKKINEYKSLSKDKKLRKKLDIADKINYKFLYGVDKEIKNKNDEIFNFRYTAPSDLDEIANLYNKIQDVKKETREDITIIDDSYGIDIEESLVGYPVDEEDIDSRTMFINEDMKRGMTELSEAREDTATDKEQALELLKNPDAVSQWKKNNKVSKEELKRRTTRKYIEQTEALQQGKMSGKEYRDFIRTNQPATKFEAKDLPNLFASYTDAVGALKPSFSAKGIVGLTTEIPEGTIVDSRLDIDGYNLYNTWIASIKTPDGNKYGRTAVLKDVKFSVSGKQPVEKTLAVAQGKAEKSPFAVMKGEWQNLSDEEAYSLAETYINNPDYVQVGFNPERHSFFYRKDNMMPVFEAEEVVQIGALVLAKLKKENTVERIGKLRGLRIKSRQDGKPATFNEGGAPMKKNTQAKQMELFGDVGKMAKNPMPTDPVSGNEIPKGSVAEEVRDDIPAQLSEGEFVLPADVVRYHGLEKIMKLRQQAKGGIDMMDKMGQMGNAEEATMPDDMPFNPKMAVGGAIPGQAVGIQQPQVAQPTVLPQQQPIQGVNVNPAQNPALRQSIYARPQPIGFPIDMPFNPIGGPAPIVGLPSRGVGYKQPTNTAATPGYEDLIGAPYGQLQQSETRKYVNPETGEELYIPFVNGEPLYPIPNGYKYTEVIGKEKEPVPEDVVDTSVKTTQVSDSGGDDQQEPDTNEYRIASTLARQESSGIGSAIGELAKFIAAPGISIATAITDAITGKPKTEPKTIADLPADALPSARPESLQDVVRESKARELGYNSYGALKSAIGVDASFRFGTKPGDISRNTGKFFTNYGQSENTNTGEVAYSSFADFTKAMAASAKSGYYGGVQSAKDALAKNPNNTKAKSFLDAMNVSYETSTGTGTTTTTKDMVTDLTKTYGAGEFGTTTPQDIQRQREQREADERAKEAVAQAARDREAKEQREADRRAKEAVEQAKADREAKQQREAEQRRQDNIERSRQAAREAAARRAQERMYGGGDDNNDNGNDGHGGGSGGSSTHICTATYNNGYIDKEHFTTLRKYGIMLRKTDPYMMKAYDMFGPMLASYVHKNKYMTSFAKFITQYYKDTMDNKKLSTKQNVFKFVSKNILRPTYRIIGWTAQKLSK